MVILSSYWRKGFAHKVPAPLQLVGCEGLVIIPLAKGEQRNPIYRNQYDAVMLSSDCKFPVYAKRFILRSIWQRDAGDSHNAPHSYQVWFVSAEIDLPEYDIMNGWINIWMGKARYASDGYVLGTLFCSLPVKSLQSRNMLGFGKRQPRAQCLCGKCQDSWFAKGWVCKLVEHKAPAPPGCECSLPQAYLCAACCGWYPSSCHDLIRSTSQYA